MSIEEIIKEAVRESVREAVADLAPRHGTTALPRYLTPEQAAEIAGVTADTIREWSASGRLPRHMAGRHVRVRLDELEAFLRGKPRAVTDEDLDDRASDIIKRLGA